MFRRTFFIGVIVLLLTSALILNGLLRIQSVIASPSPPRIDNLIITASDLEAAASRLAQWKNSSGIISRVLDVEWINSTYSGVDEQERIRNCIRDFYSSFQTKYVTIFGDTDKVPIRYVYIPDGVDDPLVPTDLYYADLNYTWDDNRDGIYGDLGNDTVDGVPDVYVGRIPTSLDNTAEDVVTKIIRYKEDFDVSEDWVKRVVLAAGAYTNDGSISLNEYISRVVTDKYVTRLYNPNNSTENLTLDTLASEIDNGCIFLNFAGHSGEGLNLPSILGLIPEAWILGPHPTYFWDYEKFNYQDAWDRTNGRKLPVVVTMSCSSAKVDWTGPLGGECLGEYFVMNPQGGAIAYYGSTGIAWAQMSDSAPYSSMGEMDRRIFEAFYNGHTRLGDAWADALTKYVGHHQLNYYFNETKAKGYINAKTVMEFILLGDPTLRIYNGPQTLKVPDDYATIQGAVNAAYDGDTIFVRNGVYYEHVLVNRTVSLIGESKEGTVVDGNGTGTVFHITSSNVNIASFTVQNSSVYGGGYAGIFIDNLVVNCHITQNNIVSHGTGILIIYAWNNSISLNNIDNNNEGLMLWSASANNVIGNNITNSHSGVILDESLGNTFYHNNFLNNTWDAADITPANPSICLWDNGYPSGGNYWSDYTGIDANHDGIGDTPYFIGANDSDNYPLVKWFPYIHAIAVEGVNTSKTVILQGSIANLSLRVSNRGHFDETLNLTLIAYLEGNPKRGTWYYAVRLGAATSLTVTFAWNTSGFAEGNYTLSASLQPVSNETDTTDNNFSSWIVVTIVSDINGDGSVDIIDAIILAGSINSQAGTPRWNPNADLNGDGIIDIYDAIILAHNYGKTV